MHTFFLTPGLKVLVLLRMRGGRQCWTAHRGPVLEPSHRLLKKGDLLLPAGVQQEKEGPQGIWGSRECQRSLRTLLVGCQERLHQTAWLQWEHYPPDTWVLRGSLSALCHMDPEGTPGTCSGMPSQHSSLLSLHLASVLQLTDQKALCGTHCWS